jgi:FdrA protein
VLDVVLGYGSHPNPAEVLAPVIREAKTAAKARSRELQVVCFVCGTDRDPQLFEDQKKILANAGAELVGSSTEAADLAGMIAVRAVASESDCGHRVLKSGETR